MTGSEQPTEEQKVYLRQMAKTRGYVLDYHKVLVAEDLPFMRAVNDLLAVSYTDQRRLDRKTKELVFIAVLTALGAGKEHIKAHIEVAKREGATKEEVLELLEMLIMPCGAPKFMLGFYEAAGRVKSLCPSMSGLARSVLSRGSDFRSREVSSSFYSRSSGASD